MFDLDAAVHDHREARVLCEEVSSLEGANGTDAAACGAPTALTAKKLDKIVAGKIIFREIVFRKSVAPEIVGRMDVLISLIRPFY